MIRACLWCGGLLVSGWLLAGCSQSPLYSEQPRTPFGRYQDLRGGEPPQEELDTFGNPRPALRARLSPKARP